MTVEVTHPTCMDTDVTNFAKELFGKIGQMNFSASNGGVAIGYAGAFGEGTGVFQTV